MTKLALLVTAIAVSVALCLLVEQKLAFLCSISVGYSDSVRIVLSPLVGLIQCAASSNPNRGEAGISLLHLSWLL